MIATPGRTITWWNVGINASTTDTLRKQIEELWLTDSNEYITLEIFSGGGECVSGYALYDWILAHNINLQTIGYGQVSSMALVIYLAGKIRCVSANCYFHLHEVAKEYTSATNINISGHSDALKDLKSWQKRYIETIILRASNAPSEKVLRSIIAREHDVTAIEAVKWMIAHEIV